jgi:hypothetical protein
MDKLVTDDLQILTVDLYHRDVLFWNQQQFSYSVALGLLRSGAACPGHVKPCKMRTRRTHRGTLDPNGGNRPCSQGSVCW